MVINVSSSPQVFGIPPGADFTRALVKGLIQRKSDMSPDDLARCEIYVNTRRMQRQLRSLFDAGPALLLPKIRLITDLGRDLAMSDIPPSVSPLRRQLQVSQLIARLLDVNPDLAPRSALFDLTNSLVALMDEMQGEGVTLSDLNKLDLTDHSDHWARSLAFLNIVDDFVSESQAVAPDPEARQRIAVMRLASQWEQNPPDHPVIVAGSTGSRGTTALFMQTVAHLPQGALVLPGYDFDLPESIWALLQSGLDQSAKSTPQEDHPQFRFARLLFDLGLAPGNVENWGADPVSPRRNAVVSLALRPAPVTDQWMSDGTSLGDLGEATAEMSLIEAPTARLEATAVALVMRDALEAGKSAALITPDRDLTRRVTAVLDRWRIEPDDSAGRPLVLSAPGRLLRHISALFGQKLTLETLLSILKHPLTNTGGADRGAHLLQTRELELFLRRHAILYITNGNLQAWLDTKKDEKAQPWIKWIADTFLGLENVSTRSVLDHLSHHIEIAERTASGPDNHDTGELWLEEAGRKALSAISDFRRDAEAGGSVSPRDYDALAYSVLNKEDVRSAMNPNPNVMIWGREAKARIWSS